MKKTYLQGPLLGAIALVASLIAGPQVHADTLLSSYEGDLTSSVGADWVTGLTHSFGSDGATEGSSALALTHGTGWTQDFSLDGGPSLAQIVANSSTFSIDATTPATTSWRQMFIVMQGAGQGWTQHQFDLTAGGTATATLDLEATGIQAAAAGGDQSWWQIYLIFQGGDDPQTAEIVTMIDNVRFTAVPEPGSLALGVSSLAAMAWFSRRRHR